MHATLTLTLGPENYVLWIIGAFVLLLTLARIVRAGFPKMDLPPFKGPGAGTLLGLLILVVSIAFALYRQH
jgi:hypothetical protein